VEHDAGQGAGDAVQGLNAGDDQPAELIKPGRLHLGDDVVGAREILGQLHPIELGERLGDMGDLADPALDQHIGAQHSALTLRRPTAPSLPNQPRSTIGWAHAIPKPIKRPRPSY
jgi:hypothetical protein